MGQLASIAGAVGTGVSVYGQVQQARQQQTYAKAQAQQSADTGEAQRQVLAVQRDATERERRQALARATATARVRLAAAGGDPDGGSGAALVAGLAQDAAAARRDEDRLFNARLATSRQSLLQPDNSLNTYARAGQSLGYLARSLLD